MLKTRVLELLQDIAYPGHEFVFDRTELGGEPYLQVRFDADGETWKGRKWMLSHHMTDSEIVQTAFLAVMTALEHEAREHFTYKGRAIFGPHFHVEQLAALCASSAALDARAVLATKT